MNYLDLIQDENLKIRVKEFLVDPPSDFDAPCLKLDKCPAGAYQHHSYEGGLLEHTASIVKISLTLCDIIEEYYEGRVNRDYVIAGAILHDVMKCYCYEESEDGGFRGSEFGGRVDHLTLMVAELMKRGLPLEIIHVVAGHHGDVGPTKPRTIEALIVSLADLVDSELNSKLLRAAEYLLKRVGVAKPRILSGRDAVKVVSARDHEGWEGIQRLLKENPKRMTSL